MRPLFIFLLFFKCLNSFLTLFFPDVLPHVDEDSNDNDEAFCNLLPVGLYAEQGQAVSQHTQD